MRYFIFLMSIAVGSATISLSTICAMTGRYGLMLINLGLACINAGIAYSNAVHHGSEKLSPKPR